jgi:hypothetical protein
MIVKSSATATRPVPGEEEMANEDSRTRVNRDALLDTLVAELAFAAYCAALRTNTQGTWLDLELNLWKALADAVEKSGREASRCR